MKHKHAVIYVFGLGDYRSRGQQFVINLWKLYGFTPSVYRMQWREDQPFDAKLDGLLGRIDALAADGLRVSLVGTSAGASAVINAYAKRPNAIHRVVCICGKLRHAETIHPETFRRNPAFRTSLEVLPESLAQLDAAHRARILSIRPLRDGSVPPDDTIIEGAHGRTIPTSGHSFSIAAAITLFSPVISRFIKQD